MCFNPINFPCHLSIKCKTKCRISLHEAKTITQLLIWIYRRISLAPCPKLHSNCYMIAPWSSIWFQHERYWQRANGNRCATPAKATIRSVSRSQVKIWELIDPPYVIDRSTRFGKLCASRTKCNSGGRRSALRIESLRINWPGDPH